MGEEARPLWRALYHGKKEGGEGGGEREKKKDLMFDLQLFSQPRYDWRNPVCEQEEG
jgi:hypothetical protein